MSKFAGLLFSLFSAAIFITYLLSCFTPYVSPASWWPISFLGLGFPLLAFASLACVCCWFFIRPKFAVALLILFFAGYKNIFAIAAFNFPAPFATVKDTAHLRVLSWNVKRFASNNRKDESPEGIRRRMINYIRETNPDVLLFQEFLERKDKYSFSNIEVLRDTLGYKYYINTVDQGGANGHYQFGIAIFSKLPFSNPVQEMFYDLEQPESILSVDLDFAGKKTRVFTTHLISLNIGPPPHDAEFFRTKDSYSLLHRSYAQKIKHYDSIHARQADYMRKLLDKSPYPVIISGDFNSVPSSFTYHRIKGDLQDTFLKKGVGLGNTYIGLSPTLRIDYILANKCFEVVQYKSPTLYLSDHFPVIADLKWK